MILLEYVQLYLTQRCHNIIDNGIIFRIRGCLVVITEDAIFPLKKRYSRLTPTSTYTATFQNIFILLYKKLVGSRNANSWFHDQEYFEVKLKSIELT